MRTITVFGITLLAAAALWGADGITPLDVKLGLWETRTSTHLGGVTMPAMPVIPAETLAKMPPAQREQVEAAMKARGAGGPMSTTTKYCITPEQLNNPMAFSRGDRSCKSKMVSSSSTRQQVHVDCDHEGRKTAGDLTIERIDPRHIKGNMAMKGDMNGHPVDMTMSFDSRWLSSDCGNVKPPQHR